jgi:hypothetical protein
MRDQHQLQPSGAMLGEVLGGLERGERLGDAVASVQRLTGLTGVRPGRASVLQLLEALLQAKTSSSRRHDSQGQGQDDIGRLLQVVVELYSPGGEGGGEGDGECVYYEDLERLFRSHGADIEEYDI